MIRLNRTKLATIFFSCIFTLLLQWPLTVLSESLPNEFPRTVGTITRESADSAIIVFDDNSFAANEFPKTVGTVKEETDGFSFTWDNSKVLEAFKNLDIFGWFASNDNQQQQQQLALAKLHNQTDADINNINNIKKKDGSDAKEQTTTTKNTKVSNSNNSKDAPNKDLKEELQEASGLIFSNTQKNKEDKQSMAVAALEPSHNREDQEDKNKDKDWRTERQWWQRGTPVL